MKPTKALVTPAEPTSLNDPEDTPAPAEALGYRFLLAQLQAVQHATLQVANDLDQYAASRTLLQELISYLQGEIGGAVFWLELEPKRLERYARATPLQPTGVYEEITLALGAEVLTERLPLIFQAQQLAHFIPQLQAIPAPEGPRLPQQVLAVPIFVEEDAVGLINLYSYSGAGFTDGDVQFVELVALHVAPHFRNTRLYEQQRRKLHEVQTLNRLLATINSSLDIETILKTIRRSVANIFRFEVIYTQLIEPEYNQLAVKYLQGPKVTAEQLDSALKITTPLQAQDSIPVRALKEGKPIQLMASESTPFSPSDRALYEAIPYRSQLIFPLQVGQQATGVLGFLSHSFTFQLTPTELEVVGKYVTQVANAIENARLLEESRQAQQRLMLRNIFMQSQAEVIRNQNETLSAQQESILAQKRELEALVKVMQAVNHEVELERILDRLLEEGMQMIPAAQAVSFLVFDTDQRTFRFVAQRGLPLGKMDHIQLSWKETVTRYTPGNDEVSEGVYLIRRPQERSAPLPQLVDVRPSAALLAMTLTIKGAIIGFMIFDNFDNPEAFTEEDRHKLERFQAHAASAFYKARYLHKIQDQKLKLEAAYQKISDSIVYARRILEAILPRAKDIVARFPESFFLFRPKDIVSGDFYWFSHRPERDIIAAVDCTGHGIPGAFMSVLGNTLLNHIVNEKGITDPGSILNELNHRVKRMLGQFDSNSESFDGMDVALCSYDFHTRKLYFAGANRPLFHIHNNTITEIKGDKHPVGGNQAGEAEHNFATQVIHLQPGDTIYLTTDGYTDQFSTGKRRKFLNTRLKELLLTLQALSMQAQQKALEEAIDKWRGRVQQLDDILVIGIRFTQDGVEKLG